MAKLSHNIEYFFARSGVALARSMSPKRADAFGAWLGRQAHRVLTSRRRIAFDNLKQAFGDKYTDDELNGIILRVFENLGRTLVEFSRFGKTTLEDIKKIVDSRGAEKYYEEAQKRGKGSICLTAHFGCWEILGAWTATLGYPMDFLIGTQHNKKVDDLLVSFRKAMGVGIIRLSTSAKNVFKALKQNHITGIVADQHAHGSDLIINFFGRPAAAAKGPALFSLRTGCALIPCVLVREAYDRHVVISGKPIYPPTEGDETENVRKITEEYSAFFEEQIRLYPDQWLWTHRRWKV